jgi:drug/metabolite transporter (DMT)-like permease
VVPDAAAEVLLAIAGLLGLAAWGARSRATPVKWPALLMAAFTGLLIATYTVADGVGGDAGRPLSYIGWLMLLDGATIPDYAAVRSTDMLGPRLRPVAVRGLSAGVLSFVAYALVLWAQSGAPLAPVAVLREASVIVGAAIAAFLFKKRFGGPRIAAATSMMAGTCLMLTGSWGEFPAELAGLIATASRPGRERHLHSSAVCR